MLSVIEVLDDLPEVLAALRTAGFHRGREQLVLHGEWLRMQVNVADLDGDVRFRFYEIKKKKQYS